jgi:hypothetical protein
MPLVGFKPTIPVFERAKTVQALDRAATVIGILLVTANNEDITRPVSNNEVILNEQFC